MEQQNKNLNFLFVYWADVRAESYKCFTFAKSSIKELRSNIYIRKFFGVLLLASFALSNTPTKYLHWLFANHTDFVSKTLTDSDKPQINASGIDCHCETNVVIAPYTVQSAVVIKPPPSVCFDYTATTVSTIVFSQPISFGLRGPPSVS